MAGGEVGDPASEPWKDPQAEPYIRLEQVTKSFGGFVAVDSVSLKIYKSELFCLLGGSGCGKSTLLRMLAGFEVPTSGKIYIDGVDVAGIPPYERPVNMMFQSYALFPHMTVEQNIAFGLKQEGLPRQEIDSRVEEVLELVQLLPFAKRKPHQLSGGQRQRVALARSLVKRPKLLLLDEPLGALDKKLREQTQFELVNIQESVGITFVVVTHDQEEAMTLSSRIGVMDQGKIVQIGTPSEIYEYPGSRFVADFIGTVNTFAGRIKVDEPDHALIESEEAGCDLFIDHGISGTEGSEVWVAVRPEKIDISKQPPTQDNNVAKGRIDEIAYFGDQSIYHVRLPSEKIVKVKRPNLVRSIERDLSWEDEVYLSWLPSSGVVLMS
ncbi:MAG: polyamine ABC transporter ATP-binding protein [Kiloniellales bacterium]|nr:polyamine ABC transporter ATP-binding protein [Kiloniellales bacterium]MDJ0972660.1 polyamine ABC transporter ATP-binding protein [Kiloniellales bacterium]MDJ0982027.1 polyamine ABC transporter ATP-binding protein [Kiloniellales bacterium]